MGLTICHTNEFVQSPFSDGNLNPISNPTPPWTHPNTGRGSRVYPNVGAAGCGLVGAGGVLGLRPRGSGFALALLYEFVIYNLYKKCIKNVQIGANVITCTNSYWSICIQKLAKKKICIRVGISTRDQYPRLKSSRSATHHPAPSVSGQFFYIPQNKKKNTIRKMRCIQIHPSGI